MSNDKEFEPGGAENSALDAGFEQNVHRPQDENFCLEYAESLAEGDIRPYVLKDYKKEN